MLDSSKIFRINVRYKDNVTPMSLPQVRNTEIIWNKQNINCTLSSLGSRGPIFPTPENRLRHKLTIARNVANT